MDMIIVEKASSLYEALQRANRAIMTLEMERPLYFFLAESVRESLCRKIVG